MGERNRYNDDEVIGWCAYCKDPIYKGQPVTIGEDGESKYHTDCHEQEHRYYDPFGDCDTGEFGY